MLIKLSKDSIRTYYAYCFVHFIACTYFLFQLKEIRVGVLGGSAVEALTSNINKELYQRSQQYLVPTTNDAINMLM